MWSSRRPRSRLLPILIAIAPPAEDLLVLGTNERVTSIQSCAAYSRAIRSVSSGVWLTTFSSCLWLHTSCSNGATFRSPTTTRARRTLGFHLGEILLHLVQELKLVRELLVRIGVGNVAAGRHIEIVHLDLAGQRHAHMPRIAFARKTPSLRLVETARARARRRRDSPSAR